ncbi:MAG: HAD family hydrolase [Roseburia sp.]|nr:HAD family hydrolase [Roseburia sp.]MCM1098999.1 HAD family hydrolase [Ruminococcus flavefaciens]
MAGRMKRAVIFDLDGTLSDSIASLKYCGDRALAPFGYGPFPESDYKYFVGDGAANLVKRALIKAGDEKLTHFEEAFARYKDFFAADCMYQVKPYDGIPELLTELKRKGLKTAVLSNKPHLQTLEVIHTLFGEDCFDLIQGQQEGLPIKPDPAGVFRILGQLGLTAADLLYLGDTATDMKTGKSAGAFTVGALWGFRDRRELEEGGADAVIAHPLELLEYVNGESGRE